jgi:hypothetical protein
MVCFNTQSSVTVTFCQPMFVSELPLVPNTSPELLHMIYNSILYINYNRREICTRWFEYDQDDLCVNKSQFVPVIFEPPCSIFTHTYIVLFKQVEVVAQRFFVNNF